MDELKEKLKALGMEDKDIQTMTSVSDLLAQKNEALIAEKNEESKKALELQIEALKTAIKDLDDKVETQKTEKAPETLYSLAEKTMKENGEAWKSEKSTKITLVEKTASSMLNVTSSFNKTSRYEGVETTPMFNTPIFDLFSKGDVTESRIEWVDRGTPEGATAIVDRGDIKPLMSFNYTDRTARYVTLAGVTKISKQLRSDLPAIMREAEEVVSYDLSRQIEHELLFSTNTDIPGITTKAAAYATTSLDGKVKNANYADAIRASMLQINSLGYKADVAVVNIGDLAVLDLSKDSNGNYIKFQIDGVLKQLRVVESIDIPSGSLLVADSTKWKVRGHGGISIDLFDQNEDDARRNLLMLRVERDIFNYVCDLHTGSAVYDTYTNIIQAIGEPAA